MIKHKILVLILLIGLPYASFSQFGVTHSVGVIAGRIEFRSDYGQRGDTKTNLNNMGFGISVVDYMNFSYKDNVNDYFKEQVNIFQKRT